MLFGLVVSLYFTPQTAYAIPIAFLVAILVLASGAWIWSEDRTARKRGKHIEGNEPSGLPSLPSARLVLVGEAVELKEISEAEPRWEDPFIVRYSPRVLTGSITRPWELFKIAIAFGIAVILYDDFAVSPALLFPIFLSTKCLLDWGHASFRPTYLRIGAGWLEIVRFGLWKRKGRVQTFVSLFDARIVCRFNERRLQLFSPVCRDAGNDGNSSNEALLYRDLSIDLRDIPERHAFVRALFLAARSTKSAPRLPLCVLAE